MSGVINTLPSGLLGFLGLKNGGQYPRALGELLQPTWDLAAIYLSANSSFDNTTLAIAAIGATAIVTVPEGEAWFIIQQDAGSATLAAGQSIALGLQFTDPAGLVTMSVSDASVVATVGQRASISLPRPYYAGPGTRLGIVSTVFAAGPINVTLSTQFARLAL